MASNDDLKKWDAGLRAKFPWLGNLRRKWTMDALEAHRNDRDVVPLLVEAMGLRDEAIAVRAGTALADLGGYPAVDALCALWALKRDERLGQMIAERNYLASQPLQLKVLSALKCGKRVVLDRADVIPFFISLLADADEAVRCGAARSLEQMAPGAAQDALCDEAIKNPTGAAAKLCLATGKRPSDQERACLFLFVTRQLDEYFQEDFEFQNLRLQYGRADSLVREHIIAVLRSGDRRTTGFWTKSPLSESSEEETRLACESWLQHAEWPQLFRACLQLPLKLSLDLWSALVKSGWKPEARDEAALFEELLPHITRLAAAPDGARSLNQLQFGGVLCTDGQTESRTPGQQMVKGMRHRGRVNRAAFAPDGKLLVTASRDGKARVWDAATGELALPVLVHESEVTHALFSPDGRRIATSTGGIVRIWDVRNGACAVGPIRHAKSVPWIMFHPDGSRLATACRDGTARVWDLHSGRMAFPPLRHEGETRCAVFDHNGAKIVTLSSNRTVRVWDAVTGESVLSPIRYTEDLSVVQFTSDSSRIVAAGVGGVTRLWDAATGSAVDHDGCRGSSDAGPHGTRIAKSGRLQDGLLTVWDLRTGASAVLPKDGVAGYDQAIFSRDRTLVAVSCGPTARVWDLSSKTPVTPDLRHQGMICHMVFSPDGGRLLTSSEDGTARIWYIGSVLSLGRLWPAQAKPLDLERLAAIRTSDPKTVAAVNVVRRLVGFQLTIGSFEEVIQDPHEFAGSFVQALEVFTD